MLKVDWLKNHKGGPIMEIGGPSPETLYDMDLLEPSILHIVNPDVVDKGNGKIEMEIGFGDRVPFPLGFPFRVHPQRIEDFCPDKCEPMEVIISRGAFAPYNAHRDGTHWPFLGIDLSTPDKRNTVLRVIHQSLTPGGVLLIQPIITSWTSHDDVRSTGVSEEEFREAGFTPKGTDDDGVFYFKKRKVRI